MNYSNKQLSISQKIIENFDANKAKYINEYCEIKQVSSNKIGILASKEINLTPEDKKKFKYCIYSIYGNDVNIVLLKSSNQKIIWNKIRNDLYQCFNIDISKYIIEAWFDKLEIIEDLVANRIKLIGKSFFIDYINNNFSQEIEYVAIKNNITIELNYKNNDTPVIIYPFRRIDAEKLSKLRIEADRLSKSLIKNK